MNEIEQIEQQYAELAARQWWHWRHHYLEAKRQPHRAAELLSSLDSAELALFESVYRSRLTAARMANPAHAGIEASVLTQLVAEADAGHVPLGHDDYAMIAPVPLVSPFEASFHGEKIALAQLAQHYRIPILGVASVVVLLVFYLLFAADPAAQAAPTVPTPVPTPWPSHAPLLGGDLLQEGIGAAQQVGDSLLPSTVPTSLELGSVVYHVEPTSVRGDAWQVAAAPGVASWLRGSYVNIVVCLAGIPDLAPGTPLQVWDTSGTVKRFAVQEVFEVQRHEIDVLAQRSAGLTILSCGGTDTTRAVLTAIYLEESHE